MTSHKGALHETYDPKPMSTLAIQVKYNTRYINYWLDTDEGKIFCLVDAPDTETANAVHREAHGLVADSIHRVVQG